ncbi:uncharacterized protein P174DRAFT_455869 [Aspergillus novofumigatus IBT 16806]|uniref:Uncharacterized protein n=1 Tax=Aspergillus novofumigatus (strain IBT 16806) TaxID=1392255 RepID=A0A2I1CKE7_ASPN1|nr:uncharacterized protein P174DRAFT_455869 [Aspergillus novofumigatus IBT 16806]PKX98104.1 hypothetical protein P174DRAFT_455869 [Aspergillus novofumigatus IBT 16806]
MPVGTPSPFRFPQRPGSSARPSAASQFASTPRFLLSQKPTGPEKAKAKDEINTSDPEESPRSTPLSTARVEPQQRGRELIEDLQDDATHLFNSGLRKAVDDISDSETNHTTPPEGAGDIDAAFDALFGPTTVDRRKRRRISLDEEPSTTQPARHNADMILTSSPETSAFITDPPSSPIPFRTPKQNTLTRGTVAAARQTPRPATPASTAPFRDHPRFKMFQPALSSQSQFTPRPTAVSASQLPTPGPQRQKPVFVLPRSPSPSRMDDESMIPTPFSPSSHALRRRGRPRSSTANYLPGGMASDVRSWILETGAKSEQIQKSLNAYSREHQTQAPPDLSQYYLVLRILDVRQSALGSSGPVAYIRGVEVTVPAELEREISQSRRVLLLGPPRPASLQSSSARTQVPELRTGHLVGVFRSLVWEVGLEQAHAPREETQENEELVSSLGCDTSTENLEEWLVGMQWELIDQN